MRVENTNCKDCVHCKVCDLQSRFEEICGQILNSEIRYMKSADVVTLLVTCKHFYPKGVHYTF